MERKKRRSPSRRRKPDLRTRTLRPKPRIVMKRLRRR